MHAAMWYAPRDIRWEQRPDPTIEYLPELLGDVLGGSLDASAVFDLQLPMEQVAEAYAAMDERRSIKTLLWP
jgi:threonine dehydrogenase-like Zn-dependent dehydrogenase